MDKISITIFIVTAIGFLLAGLLASTYYYNQGVISESHNTILFGQKQFINGFERATNLSYDCFDYCNKTLTKDCIQQCIITNKGW